MDEKIFFRKKIPVKELAHSFVFQNCDTFPTVKEWKPIYDHTDLKLLAQKYETWLTSGTDTFDEWLTFSWKLMLKERVYDMVFQDSNVKPSILSWNPIYPIEDPKMIIQYYDLFKNADEGTFDAWLTEQYKQINREEVKVDDISTKGKSPYISSHLYEIVQNIEPRHFKNVVPENLKGDLSKYVKEWTDFMMKKHKGKYTLKDVTIRKATKYKTLVEFQWTENQSVC